MFGGGDGTERICCGKVCAFFVCLGFLCDTLKLSLSSYLVDFFLRGLLEDCSEAFFFGLDLASLLTGC